MNQKSHVHVANRIRIWFAWILALLLWIQGTSFPVRAEEPPSSSYSFENTILSVSWKVRPEWNSEFQSIDSAKPIEIKPNDTYQLTIKYELPQGTLTAESPSCSYQLPSQLTFSSPVSGTIQNGGTAVGTYSIDTSGQVVLQFYEKLVSENVDGKVYGDLQFDIKGKEIVLDNSTETVIRFNNSNQFTLTGPALDPEPEKGSLQVQKTGEKKEGRTMSYTITVTATGDTTEDVVVTDVLKSGSATYKENSLVVKKSDGTSVSPVEPSFQDQSFQLTLPPLLANESYTITYEMEADSLKNETNTIKNYVEAQTTDANKTGSWGPDLTFTSKMLEKTGVLQADKKTILWTVTLNEANEDLNGWTLQDEWNQIPVKEVSIKPSVDGNDKISLPYTFSSTDTTTYTITYTTPADVLLGTSQTLNKVVLENEEEKIEQETGVYVPDSEDAQPIQKEGVALKPIGPNLYEAEWMVRLNLDYSSLSPGWTYTDRLSGDGTSSYSAEQKKALMEAIANAFGVTNNQVENENGFTSDTIDFSWVKEEWESEAKTFQITGKTSLPQGTTIKFTYFSTVEIEEGNLYNNGVLKDRGKEANASGELTVKPILRKNDPLSPGSSWTYHSRKELKDDILRWEVVVNIPEHQTKALTLVDTLPNEVTYSNAFVKDKELKPEVQGNTVTWTLDEAFVQANQGKTITFVVEAKLVEQNLTWRNDETTDPKIRRIHVKNQAEIIQEEDLLKKVEQTQTIWESTVRNRIEKTDPKASGKETAHRFEELENGQVIWKIAQYIEENQTKPLTVQDSIPQGLRFEEGKVRCDGKEVDANFTLQENTLSLALDEQFIVKWRGKTLELTLAFSIKDDFSWNVDPDHPKNATGLFKNECQVLEEGTVVDTDEQTQTITKNLFENALKKTGNYDSSTGVLSYTVVINPDGKTFGGEDGLIHLHDRLKYHYKGDYDSYRVYFMPEKTVLYEVAGDGEKKEIDRKDWHLRYKIGPEQWNPDMQQIDLDVPDGKSLELTYCYQVWGRKTLEQSIGNSIELTVNDKSYAESSTSVAAKTITSSANAGTRYVTLRKVDEQDINVFLPGAKFDLYRYDKEKNDYVKEDNKSAQVSNANGTIQFNDLAFNTAYYLKEIEAPSGYLLDETPFYFYIVGTDTSSTTFMPDGFETDPNTHTYMNQSNLYITNKANTTSLTVRKKWLDAQGVELSGPTREAEVDLIRYTHDEPPDDSFQYSLNIKSSGTVLLEQTNVPVKKGSVLEITFELLNVSSGDGIIHDQNWNGYSPVESISGIPGEETWQTYTRFTYRIPLQENNLILTAENWGLRFPKVTLIEPELNGTVIESIPLNNQNDYKTTIPDLITEENINGKKVYYTYDVQEQPMAGFDATYEKLTTETGVEIVVTNRRKENGGFVFPETGANKNQISAYVGGVMIASLICVRIWNRRKSKER